MAAQRYLNGMSDATKICNLKLPKRMNDVQESEKSGKDLPCINLERTKAD